MPSRRWSETEIEYVCDRYGTGVTLAEIAVGLGRTRSSVVSWVRKSGLPRQRRPFTEADRQHIRDHYGRTPTREIAATLGRTLGMVHRQATYLGLTKAVPHMTLADCRRLKKLAADGYCNRCIGRQIGKERHTVCEWRRRLGLPPVASRGMLATCQTCIAKVKANTARQLERAGLPSLGAVRRRAFEDYARRHGWPEDLRPRAVQILNVLAREGPKTKIELAEAIGMRWRGLASRQVLVSNDPEGSYLAHLMKRGLVVALGRAYRQGYRWEMIYSISPFAERQGNDA